MGIYGNYSAGLGAAGGGNGSIGYGNDGLANTGSGGGGGDRGPTDQIITTYSGGAGGSGIVILRYPSYLAPATSTTGGPETYIAGAWRVYKFVASGTITF